MQMCAHGGLRQALSLDGLFSTKKEIPEGSAKTHIFLSRYLGEKFDGNVDVVTWAQAQ